MSETVIINAENKNETLVLFFSYRSYLSNFYLSKFVIDGITFTSMEQYFHYMKALTFNDKQAMDNILKTNSPSQQKRIGRTVKNFNQSKWSAECSNIMHKGLFAKFTQNEELKNKLLSIPNVRFVEASPYDKIWGIGLAADHPNASKPSKWLGKNLLGEALTDLRDVIAITDVI
jgi:ribA/ribD-fused uncharacterized protein